MQKNVSVIIEGGSANTGTINGGLPGVPVMVEVQPKDIAVAEAPGPSNGWNRVVLRSKSDRNIVVTLHWQSFGR
jgi:hypothetical protein